MVSLSTVMTIAERHNDARNRICTLHQRIVKLCRCNRILIYHVPCSHYFDWKQIYLGNLTAFDSSIICSRRLSLVKTERSFLETTDFARSPGRRKSNLATPYNASILSFRRIRRTKKIVVTTKIIAAKLKVIHSARMFL